MSTSTATAAKPVKPPTRKYQPRLRAPDPATENPSLPIYLTTCFVCKEEAKPGEQHTLHYGGIVCLSCRAFFRRSHQATKVPEFKCKKKGNCPITTENRRRCQRCRYNRCVRAGMKPESVLTDDQKKVRFRKVYMKKAQAQNSSEECPNALNNIANVQNDEPETDYKSENEENEEPRKLESPIPDLPWPQFDAPIEPILDFSPIPAEACQPEDLSPYSKQAYHQPQPTEVDTNWLNGNSASENAHQTRDEFAHNFRRLKNLQDEYYSRYDQQHQQHQQQLQQWSHPPAMIPASTSIFPPPSGSSINSPSTPTKRFQPEQGMHHANAKICKYSPESVSEELCKPEIVKTESPPSPFQSQPPPLTPWPPVPDEATSPTVASPSLEPSQDQHRNFWLHAKEEEEDDSDDGQTQFINSTTEDPETSLVSLDEGMTAEMTLKETYLAQKIEGILKTHFIAIRQMETPSYSKIVVKLGNLHSGENSAFKSITRSEMLTHMINMSERFRHFALLQRAFCRLPKNDQRQLLARNSALYIQLYMGCFFGAPSGAKQKELIQKYQIITRKQKSLESSSEQKQSTDNLINMYQFNAITRLFRPDSDLDYYVKLIEIFRNIKVTSLESRAIISYLILFDFDDKLILSNRDALIKMASKKQELFEKCFGKNSNITMKDLMNALVKMSVFGAYNIMWDDIVLPAKSPSLAGIKMVMAYTDEEEAWLNKQLQHYNDAYLSVPMGEEILKEAMMNSLGVPLSKTFFTKNFAIYLERFWRIVKHNPELTNLSASDVELLKKNCKNALAIFLSKLECCKNGLEQVQMICSQSDMIEWKKIYLPLFNASRGHEVKKLTFKTSVETSSLPMTHDEMVEFYRLATSLGQTINDHIIYKIIMLMVLTEPGDEEIHVNSGLSRLNSQFRILLQRRMEWEGKYEKSHADIMFALSTVPQIVQILEKIIEKK